MDMSDMKKALHVKGKVRLSRNAYVSVEVCLGVAIGRSFYMMSDKPKWKATFGVEEH